MIAISTDHIMQLHSFYGHHLDLIISCECE